VRGRPCLRPSAEQRFIGVRPLFEVVSAQGPMHDITRWLEADVVERNDETSLEILPPDKA
jgi:hypothetical protein